MTRSAWGTSGKGFLLLFPSPTPVTTCFPVPGGFLHKTAPRKGEDGHGLLPP